MTPGEVPVYTAIDLPFNVCSFRELFSIEYRQARVTIGFDLWQAMVNARADYSSEPDYSQGATYAEGDVVKYKGVHYRAIEAAEGVTPTNTVKWEAAPKFDESNDCAAKYEKFWCTFLAPYLANLVLAQRLPFIHTRIKDVGVLTYEGNDYDTADVTSYDRLIKALYRDTEIAKGNIEHWINYGEHAGSECFKDYKDIITKEDCDDGTGTERTGATPRTPGGYDFG